MMSEIMQRGPITCSIACPDDFIFNYTGGVYTDMNNSTDVDHDVEVVGWGHEDGKEFWHIRNSWGEFLCLAEAWKRVTGHCPVVPNVVMTCTCTAVALLCADLDHDICHNILLFGTIYQYLPIDSLVAAKTCA